jgi:hypothetical protein
VNASAAAGRATAGWWSRRTRVARDGPAVGAAMGGIVRGNVPSTSSEIVRSSCSQLNPSCEMQESSAFPPNASDALLILVFTAHTPNSLARPSGLRVCCLTSARLPFPCRPIPPSSPPSPHTFRRRSLFQTFSSSRTSRRSCEHREPPSNVVAATARFRFKNCQPSTNGLVGVVGWWTAGSRQVAAASIAVSRDIFPRARA